MLVFLVTNSKADPFDASFDAEMVQQEMERSGITQHPYTDFIFYLFNMYQGFSMRITEHFRNAIVSKANFLDRIFAKSGLLPNMVIENLAKVPHETLVHDIGEMHFFKADTDTGEQLDLSFMIEIGPDVTGEVLLWLERLDTKHDFFAEQTSATEEKIDQIVNHLWMFANIIVNIKNTAYPDLKYENGTVEIGGEQEFFVKTGLRRLSQIRTAGIVRWTQHITEYEFFLRKLLQAKELPFELKVSDKNGLLHIEIIDRISEPDFSSVLANIMQYHDFLVYKKLDYFGGMTIEDIARTIYLFQETFSKVIMKGSAFSLKISKTNLSETITTVTGQPREIAEKIVDSMVLPAGSGDLWRFPFYSFGEHYYFLPINLASPNYNLFIDRWIRLAGVTADLRIELFAKSVAQNIEYNENKHNYELAILAMEKIGLDSSYFKDVILIETRDYCVVVQAAVYDFTINANERNDAMIKLGNAGHSLRDKCSLIEQRLINAGIEKKIMPLVVANYPLFSGISTDGISWIDDNLLGNYFNAGRYSLNRSVVYEGVARQGPVGTMEYYANEDQFNENIPTYFEMPQPVYLIIKKLFLTTQLITPPFFSRQIKIEKPEYKKTADLLSADFDLLDETLKKWYFADEKEDQVLLDNQIQFTLAGIFGKLSFGNIDLLQFRADMYQAIKAVREGGFFHLTVYIIQTIQKIRVNPYKNKLLKPKLWDHLIEAALEKLTMNLEKRQSYSTIDLKTFLDAPEKDVLLNYSIAIISSFTIQDYDQENTEIMENALLILCGLRHDYDVDELIETGFTNLTEYFNQNQHYQQARDTCEELLHMLSKDNKHWLAWSVLFRCYTSQRNHYDAVIYGSLFFTALYAIPKQPYFLLVGGLHNAVIFFRNFHYPELAKKVFDKACSLDLEMYDSQKLHCSYYNSLLIDPNTSENSFIEIINYIEKQKKSLIGFGYHGIIPWIALLYNLQRLSDYGKVNDKRIADLIGLLEENMDTADIARYRLSIIGEGSQLKTKYTSMITEVFKTRSINDFVAEIYNLTVIADALFEQSFKNADFAGMLLSGFVLNDQSFTYSRQDLKTELSRHFNAYDSFIIDNLSIKTGRVICWIVEIKLKMYCIVIDENNAWKGFVLNEWNKNKAEHWTGQLKRFFFNSEEKADYNIEVQEADYSSLRQTLAFTRIPAEISNKELLICCSISAARFPHQLYSLEQDFIGAVSPVCNILSIEKFCFQNNKQAIVRSNSSTAWIPVQDGHHTIQWGYDLLQPVLHSFSAKIITNVIPEKRIETDLNIFLAHGEMDSFGFKAVHFDRATGGSIFHPAGIFGKGKVAILFICNTGRIAEDFYSNSIVSFATELLKNNYEAVVAPFWKLDVTITPIWLSAFMASFSQGKTLTVAVFEANAQLAQYHEKISGFFYAAEARLAMHLYGNPDIVMAQESIEIA